MLAGLLLLGQGAASVINAPDPRPRLGRAYNGILDGGNSTSFSLSRRQGSSPQCGAAANGARCTNNLCCSQWGYCGSTDLYCSNISGCQPAYGLINVHGHDDNLIDDRYNQLHHDHQQQHQQQQQQHCKPNGCPPTRAEHHPGRLMWQQQVLPWMGLRPVLLPVRLLRLWGHVLFLDCGLPGRVRRMRGIVVNYYPRRAIHDVYLNEQLIFLDCHDNNDLGDHQHQLYEQQCQCEPNGLSPPGPEHDDRRNLWQ
ncbi:hypothetical protein LA080_006526 [Diaporthe eres]|nr:hypothetical protein LA080_006526 [Diaporthe eres]